MSALNTLLLNIPIWVGVEDRHGDTARIVASPPLEGGKPTRAFHLRLIPSSKGGVSVFEQEDRRQWPDFCLERHINSDGSLCVFYGSEDPIVDDSAAKIWWGRLATFLNNQVYAEKFRLWPPGAGLSHAEAADEQIAMEKLAEPLGWKEDEIWEGIFRRRGWLAEKLPRLSKDRQRVVNARSPCPRGCTWKHKLLRKHSCAVDACDPHCRRRHKPVLRVECPHRETIERIVLHEHRRRKIEAQVINKLYREGRRCCGTMKICPLRDIAES